MSSNTLFNLSNLQKKYSEKEVKLEKAILDYIKPGYRIFIGSGCSEPIILTKELIKLAQKLPDVEIMHALSLSDLDYYATSDSPDLFRYNAFFIGRSLRDYVARGLADYTPMLLSEIPKVFKTGQIHLDTALIQVSPPNKKGLCSFGINVDITKAMAESAESVVAEINPNMPRTMGDSFIHMDDIDAYVIADHEIIEFSYAPPDQASKKIGKFVASLIEDGSTIQIGIGKLPNAIIPSLLEKKDLGIHSVVITDAIVDLVEKGVITCKKKTLNKGKIITAFGLGTRKLYDFVNENPFVEFHPCDYVNDPNIIGQNEKQVSINGAISVDITGQVNADSLGYRFYSGIGGLIDFTRGAARSIDGKPIIVLPSTATLHDGRIVSRIVPCLQSCSGVVLTRGMTHYVITEWGIAYLYGKSIRERVLQMINIAHPDFREELLEHAKNCNYVYSDQELTRSVDGKLSIYPDKYETRAVLKNGKTIFIRPVKPSDERMIQELHYSLSKDEVYYRFFSPVKDFRHKRIQPMVNIDYSVNMILVCINEEKENKEIIATGGFFKTEDPSTVEMAWVVREDWRGNQITRLLLKHLIKIARELRYRSFCAHVISDNKPMMHILNTCGYPIISKEIEDDIVKFIVDIQKRININDYIL
ncbi:MAG: GNAT family N-acetyltransferase [Promethearchaeota archaeon]